MSALEPFAVFLLMAFFVGAVIYVFAKQPKEEHPPEPVKAKPEGPLIIRPHRGER